MNGPKLAAVLVAVVMMVSFGYIVWSSRQFANAFDETGGRTSVHVERIERVVQEVEMDMGH